MITCKIFIVKSGSFNVSSKIKGMHNPHVEIMQLRNINNNYNENL